MKQLDSEKICYVFTYFGHLMTDYERIAWRHYTSTVKLGDMTGDQRDARTRMYLKKGWMSDKPEVLILLDNGIDSFKEEVVRRILAERTNEVGLNTCPQCGQLVRTPHAKQCKCGHSWR